MFRSDPAGIAYAAAAVAFVVLAVVVARRRSPNPRVGKVLVLVLLAACWWSLADAVAVSAVDEHVAAVASLAIFPGLSAAVAAFVLLAVAITRAPTTRLRRLGLLLLVEPALITAAAATNPWHQLVYTGPGADRLTGSASWGFGPVFWAHSVVCYAALAVGMGLVAHWWWSSARAFRLQRLSLLVAVLVPAAINVVNLAGGLPVAMDPTPVGLAVTGTVMAWSLFRQHLFAFTPVARALILERIDDAIVAVSPMGDVIDLNPAAVALVRRLRPDTDAVVGARAEDLFGAVMAGTGDEPTEVSVTLDGEPAELHVRSSSLVDRRGRSLGSVLVARDVTEVMAQSRRLEAANRQLTHQVETIERLRADLAELAARDPLTGLHNRRHLVDELERLLPAAQASGDPLAVVLLDVDRFKTINDTYGHLAGDAVLVEVARRLAADVPPGALVARWGGEEFVVALPGADAAAGIVFADSVRRRLEDEGVHIDAGVVPCTLSGGVATFPVDGTTSNELFHAADVSLYEAKASGRNQVLTGASLRRAPVTAGPGDRLVAPARRGHGPGSVPGEPH